MTSPTIDTRPYSFFRSLGPVNGDGTRFTSLTRNSNGRPTVANKGLFFKSNDKDIFRCGSQKHSNPLSSCMGGNQEWWCTLKVSHTHIYTNRDLVFLVEQYSKKHSWKTSSSWCAHATHKRKPSRDEERCFGKQTLGITACFLCVADWAAWPRMLVPSLPPRTQSLKA